MEQRMSDPDDTVLYYQPGYLALQPYDELKVIAHSPFQVCFSIVGNVAKSLPRSPIGGIFSAGAAKSLFFDFIHQVQNELKQIGVTKIIINQPPFFYTQFAPAEWLQSIGFSAAVTEVLQYVRLDDDSPVRLHQMEKRKLKKAGVFNFLKGHEGSVAEIHAFIAACRRQNNLEINVSLDTLQKLTHYYPERYEYFEARYAGELAAAVVMVIPVPGVAYYYLPATSPRFKRMSPMVGLLEYIYTHYRARNFTYLDLGLSSIDGSLQESLFRFKERMGAKPTSRPTLTLEL